MFSVVCVRASAVAVLVAVVSIAVAVTVAVAAAVEFLLEWFLYLWILSEFLVLKVLPHSSQARDTCI